MIPDGPAVCAKCRHSARGEAIDHRVTEDDRVPPGPRSSLAGGDYICAREGLTPGKRDPVTGFEPPPSGPDCRDLNPDGACPHYRRGITTGDTLPIAMVIGLLWVAAGLIVFALGGEL